MTPASHPPVGRLLAPLRAAKAPGGWWGGGVITSRPSALSLISTTSRRIDRPMRLPGPISRTPRVLRQPRRLEDDISDVLGLYGGAIGRMSPGMDENSRLRQRRRERDIRNAWNSSLTAATTADSDIKLSIFSVRSVDVTRMPPL